jgi:hypothetical protein
MPPKTALRVRFEISGGDYVWRERSKRSENGRHAQLLVVETFTQHLYLDDAIQLTACEPSLDVCLLFRAVLRMFSNKGLDHSLGARLPALLQKAKLKSLSVENDAPTAQGASGVAEMMKMSTRHLQAKYLATGEATDQDVDNYCTFAQSPDSWAIYYATVSVVGQK